MLQRFMAMGLMGLVISLTACDRVAQLQQLDQSHQYQNAAQTSEKTAEHPPETAAENTDPSAQLEDLLPFEIQGSPSAQLKANLKEQARRAKQSNP